jgi:LytS/YehU family sensor histidine kinase
LFNSLNGIYALAIKKSDATPDAVLQLSELMRHMLYESEKEEVALGKEVEYLRNYLQLQKLRMPEGAQINFDVEGDVGGKMIAPMLFIPFIENGFKHGVDIDGVRIQIKLKVKDNTLTFDMINSISGSTSKDASSGIGLANVRKRLDLLYGNKYHLDYKESNGNFVVHLQLNLSA